MPMATRPASRLFNPRGERSPNRTSLLPQSGHGQRDSKYTSASPSPVSPPLTPAREQPGILFYHSHDPYYGFTNFSNHPVVYNGKKYPTSEHLFQSFKFQEHKPDLAEHIRTCSERPSVAFSEARRFQPEVRRDWKAVNIAKMDIVLQLKFEQHDDLRAELLGTGDANLFEDSDKDAFWGVGPDWTGRNELGKALERLRTKLRNQNLGGGTTSAHDIVKSPTRKLRKLEVAARDPPNHNIQPFRYSVQSPSATAQSPVHIDHESPDHDVQSPSGGHGLQLPIYGDIQVESDTDHAALVVFKRELCRIPGCKKPAYYDGKVQSNFCSQEHRHEAVTSGLVEACIKCRRMPQSEADFFCGHACREEALKKTQRASVIVRM